MSQSGSAHTIMVIYRAHSHMGFNSSLVCVLGDLQVCVTIECLHCIIYKMKRNCVIAYKLFLLCCALLTSHFYPFQSRMAGFTRWRRIHWHGYHDVHITYLLDFIDILRLCCYGIGLGSFIVSINISC